MDGPVEIELDPTPPSRRGRRDRGRRDESHPALGDRHLPGPHRPSLSLGGPDSGPDVGTAGATCSDPARSDPPPVDSGTAEDRSSAAGRRARLVVSASSLLLVGFLLGRAGMSEPGRVAEVADATPTSTEAPPPTTRPAVDRSLVTLPAVSPPRPDSAPTNERAPSRDRATTSTTTTVAPPQMLDLGGPLVASPTGLVVVGLTTEGQLAEIDLDSGVARLVEVPDLPGHQAVNSGFLHVGTSSAVVGSWERQTLHVVPVGGEPYQMSTALSRSAHVIAAGPGPDLFWVQPIPEPPDYGFTIALADVAAGAIVGDEIGLDVLQWGMHGPLGLERVLFNGVGGTYQVDVHLEGAAVGLAARRVSDGVVVAIGASHVLAIECDEQLACAAVLIGDDGERTVTGAPISRVGWPWNPAPLSPDGSTVVLLDDGRFDGGLTLIDLASGAETTVVTSSQPFSSHHRPTQAAWSDDSRTVVFLSDRRLSYYDREVGEVVEIGDLPSLVTFNTRPGVPGTGTQVPPPTRQ